MMSRRLAMAAAHLGTTRIDIERRAAGILLPRRVERIAAALGMTPYLLCGDEQTFALALLRG
jgi:hypothetical protein